MIVAAMRPATRPPVAEMARFLKNSRRFASAKDRKRGGISRMPLPSGFHLSFMMQPHWLLRPIVHNMKPAAKNRSLQDHGAEEKGVVKTPTPASAMPMVQRTLPSFGWIMRNPATYRSSAVMRGQESDILELSRCCVCETLVACAAAATTRSHKTQNAPSRTAS